MIVTLLTDFGAADYFVGALKGVILSLNPQAQVVDLTHEIPPQEILAGAFTLAALYQTFPPETIHVAVVDPGVGSARRPILVLAGSQFFVGPDNGLFSFIYEREEKVRVIHLTNADYFRHPLSATFHGRDVFAPVAGALSLKVAPAKLGNEITDYVRLDNLQPQRTGEAGFAARIIHIDHFGNCITNLTREHLTEERIARGLRLTVNGREISSFRQFFAAEGRSTDELFAIWGSAGYLEIAAFRASAAEILCARRGQQIKVSGEV